MIFFAKPSITSDCSFHWLKAVDVCQNLNSHFVQISFKLRKHSRWIFGQTEHKKLFQPQHVCRFPATASNRTSWQRLQQKVFRNKVFFSFAIWRHSSVISSNEWIISTESLVPWLTVCTVSTKLPTKLSSVCRYHYRNPKLRVDRQSQKTTSLPVTIMTSLNIQIDKFC